MCNQRESTATLCNGRPLVSFIAMEAPPCCPGSLPCGQSTCILTAIHHTRSRHVALHPSLS
jgi:hypothetical protein